MHLFALSGKLTTIHNYVIVLIGQNDDESATLADGLWNHSSDGSERSANSLFAHLAKDPHSIYYHKHSHLHRHNIILFVFDAVFIIVSEWAKKASQVGIPQTE